MWEVWRCWMNLDLWFLFPWSWFINGHLDGFLIICNYDGSEWAEFCVDLFIIDGPEPVEHHTLLIPAEQEHRRIVWSESFLEYVSLICFLGVWPSPVRYWHHFIIWLVSHNVIDKVEVSWWTVAREAGG